VAGNLAASLYTDFMPLGTRVYNSPQRGYGYSTPLTIDQTRGVFGQVMGLVALTFACLALGAFLGRHMVGHVGLFFFICAFGCIFGLNKANSRGHEPLAITLLFGMGAFMGLALAPVLAYYVSANPSVVYEAAGSTAGFIGAMGAYGYATRRDLAVYYRMFFWALIALIIFGLITLFVAIPGSNIIYCGLGLVIFAFYTAFDFQRLRRANMTMTVPIAAAIFLDILNVFLFFLSLFGGGSSRRV
jgi:FtsH-binding integral membrane protein